MATNVVLRGVTRYLNTDVFCCVCRKTTVARFQKLYKTKGSYFTARGRLCEIEDMDDDAFANSPYLCQSCYFKASGNFKSTLCDVCAGKSNTLARYTVTNKDGIICIGPHKSLIFDGPIKTGRVCRTCYSRNMEAHSGRGPTRAEPPSLDVDECVDHTNDIGEFSCGHESEEDTFDLRPPPSKKRKRQEVHSNAMHEETAIPRQDPQVRVMAIVDSLMSIERAKTQTLSIKENVMAFMSHRASLQEAMGIVDQSDCNVAEFVAMQECFVAMLDNQLQTIENDRLGCIAQLTHLTSPSPSTSNGK